MHMCTCKYTYACLIKTVGSWERRDSTAERQQESAFSVGLMHACMHAWMHARMHAWESKAVGYLTRGFEPAGLKSRHRADLLRSGWSSQGAAKAFCFVHTITSTHPCTTKCIYVCIYIYMCMHAYLSVYTYVYTYIYTYACTFM